MPSSACIFVGASFPPDAEALLRDGLAGHDVVRSSSPLSSNLVPGGDDPAMVEADVWFGQPAPSAIGAARRLRWIHLTSAGYTRYATAEIRALLRERGVALTTSSTVYAEPSATHALALVLALCRQLPRSLREQDGARSWPAAEVRATSIALSERTVLVLGYGAIGKRLVAMLAPFGARVIVVRERPRGDEPVETLAWSELPPHLGAVDVVIDTLPESASTWKVVGAAFFSALKRGALFVNVGRGTTVDQDALLSSLRDGTLAGAGLDVTDPEPLPREHPLWDVPTCMVTPHTAGGRTTEHVSIVRHFLEQLARFERREPLADRVI